MTTKIKINRANSVYSVSTQAENSTVKLVGNKKNASVILSFLSDLRSAESDAAAITAYDSIIAGEKNKQGDIELSFKGGRTVIIGNKLYGFAQSVGGTTYSTSTAWDAYVDANPIPTPGPTPAQTFTLTTGVDNFTATGANSTFIAVGVGNNAVITAGSTTFNAGDRIASTAANATLDLTLSNAVANTAFGAGFRASNVPNVNVGVFGFQSTLDLGSFTSGSATNITNSGSTAALVATNLSNLATVNVVGASADTTIQFNDSLVPTGNTTVAATINVNGAINNGQAVGVTLRGVTNATDGAAAVTVNATGSASDILLNSGDNTLRTLTVNATTAPVTITAAGNGTRTVNLAGSTNTTSVDVSTSTQNVTVTGGTGSDTVIFADAQLNTGDSINLGTGTNSLGVSIARAANGAGIAAAAVAGLNAATNVNNLVLVGTNTTVGNAGTTFFNAVDFSAVNPSTVILQGFTAANGTQDYALTAGAAGGAAFTATNVTTAKNLVVQGDMSARAATNIIGAGTLSAAAVAASSVQPLQTLNIALTPGSRDLTAVQIVGGAAAAGAAGGAAGNAGNVASSALNNLGNIATVNIQSNGSTGTNSLIGGAAGAGGDGVAGNGGAAGGVGGASAVAINNAAGQTFNISGARNLTIAGGAAGAAGTANTNAGGAGGLRSLGFAAQANIQGGTATGNLSIAGSGALITNGGAAITAGNVLTVGDVITTGTGSDTILGGGGGDVITTGTGSDRIAYIIGNAGEISSGDATPTAAELGAYADAARIDRITDFATATDAFLINTGGAFFSDNQLTFTAATTVTPTAISGITGTTIADMDGLLAAFNAAVTGGAVASTAGAMRAYVFTTGSVTGGLANASNQTFLVINNSQAAINNTDFIANITGMTGSFSSSNITFGVV